MKYFEMIMNTDGLIPKLLYRWGKRCYNNRKFTKLNGYTGLLEQVLNTSFLVDCNLYGNII